MSIRVCLGTFLKMRNTMRQYLAQLLIYIHSKEKQTCTMTRENSCSLLSDYVQ